MNYEEKYLKYKKKYFDLKKKLLEQEGGDVDGFGIDRPLTKAETIAADAGAAAAIKAVQNQTQVASPTASPNSVTYNIFDPLYPRYVVPRYDVLPVNPIFKVPSNNFDYYDRDDDIDIPVRSSKRRSSKRRTSKRRTSKRRTSKKTSKRRTSKRRSSKKTSKRTSKRRSSKRN